MNDIVSYVIVAWFVLWCVVSLPFELAPIAKQVLCAVVVAILLVTIFAPDLLRHHP